MAETVDPTLLRELFLQRLPSNVRMVLTPSAGALSLADRIVEASPTPTISATDTHMHSQLTAQVTDVWISSQAKCPARSTIFPNETPIFPALADVDTVHLLLQKMVTATLLVPPHVQRQRQEMSTTLPEVGKRLGQSLSATSAAGHTYCFLQTITPAAAS